MALIHEWKFDETTGTTAIDSVGSVNGTIASGVTLNQPSNTAAPSLNTAFDFNGSTGHVNLGYNPNFTQTDSFTFSAWVKTSSPHFGAIISSFNGTAGVELALRGGVKALLYLRSNATSGTTFVETLTTYPTSNAWFLLTATYDGSGVASGIKIYFDGVNAGVSASASNISQNGTMFGASSMLIGARPVSPTVQHLNGSIDNLRVYNTALTPAAVLAEYNTYFQVATDISNTGLLTWQRDSTQNPTNDGSLGGQFNGLSGITNGGASISTPFDNCISAVGTSSADFRLSNAAFAVDKTVSKSVAGAFNLPTGSGGCFLYSQTPGSPGGPATTLQASLTNFQFLFNTNFGVGDDGIVVNFAVTLTPDTWYTYVLTYDGSGFASGVKLYVDGAAVAPSAVLFDNLNTSTSTTLPGTIYHGNKGLFPISVNVLMDETRFYNNRVLTAQESIDLDNYLRNVQAVATPVDDTATTPANTLINIAVLTNDTGITGGETITITTPPTNGAANVNIDGVTIDYTPALDYAGSDSFAYDIDASGSYATVTINVQQLLVNDSGTIDSGQLNTFDVLFNDIVSSPTVLTIQSQGTLGTATVNGLNSIDYQAGSVEGTDTIIYNANGDLATLTIQIAGSLEADSFTVTANQTTNLDVRANDAATGATTVPIQPTNGTVTVLVDDSVDYTPANNFIGADSFTYNVGTESAIVSIVVQAPEGFLVDDYVLTPMNTAILIDVLDNDTITS